MTLHRPAPALGSHTGKGSVCTVPSDSRVGAVLRKMTMGREKCPALGEMTPPCVVAPILVAEVKPARVGIWLPPHPLSPLQLSPESPRTGTALSPVSRGISPSPVGLDTTTEALPSCEASVAGGVGIRATS